jgi:hypothetical protein
MPPNKREGRNSPITGSNGETAEELTPEQLAALGYQMPTRRHTPAETVTVEVIPDGAIVPMDGAWALGRFHLSLVGVQLPSDTTEAEWQVLGQALGKFGGAIQWLIGDWLAFGERRWGKTYEDMVVLTGYEMQSLYDMVYVAKNVDFSARAEKLSFAHHKCVASLSVEHQRDWIAWAVENGVSSKAFAAEIAKWRKSQNPPPLPSGVVVNEKWDKGCHTMRRMIHGAKPEEVPQMKTMLRELLDELERRG